MNIIVTGSDAQWEILQQCGGSAVHWSRAISVTEAGGKTMDAFFYLAEDAAVQDFSNINTTVFINSIYGTIAQCNATHAAGINGWAYFLQQHNWELAGQITPAITAIAEILGKTITPVADQPGFITPRVIAMIINEAYFALEDGVSSREEIDTAMKMGTNYPYGPFEWANLLGKHNLCQLLQQLAKVDVRYNPAPILIKEALQ
jgi:3-hydroxybutyryl-CoA dehydrogenase